MRIEVTVRTDKVGSECTRELVIDDEELEDLTPEEYNSLIEDYAREQMFEMIEWNWQEKSE